MKEYKKTFLILGLAMLLGCAASRGAEDDKKPEPVKPDNTKINERDRTPDRVTADQQGQSKEDVDTTAKIRQAVIHDEALSHTAHNVKIITLNGMVTLRGPVKTEAEKTAVAKKAIDVVGEKNVKDEIEIAQ